MTSILGEVGVCVCVWGGGGGVLGGGEGGGAFVVELPGRLFIGRPNNCQ